MVNQELEEWWCVWKNLGVLAMDGQDRKTLAPSTAVERPPFTYNPIAGASPIDASCTVEKRLMVSGVLEEIQGIFLGIQPSHKSGSVNLMIPCSVPTSIPSNKKSRQWSWLSQHCAIICSMYAYCSIVEGHQVAFDMLNGKTFNFTTVINLLNDPDWDEKALFKRQMLMFSSYTASEDMLNPYVLALSG